MRDMTARTVAETFVREYVARFGVPLQITTDRGSQFESKLMAEVNNLLGASRIRTTAYHPQANGLVERFHRQLKTSIRCAEESGSWSQVLPLVLLGIRTTPRDDLRATPAEMVYGESIRVPGELFASSTGPADPLASDFLIALKNHFASARSPGTRTTDQTAFIPKTLETCTHVFVRRDAKKGLQSPYEGPFRVVRRFRKQIVIERDNKTDSVSVDRIKPAFTSPENVATAEVSLPAPNTPSTRSVSFAEDVRVKFTEGLCTDGGNAGRSGSSQSTKSFWPCSGDSSSDGGLVHAQPRAM